MPEPASGLRKYIWYLQMPKLKPWERQYTEPYFAGSQSMDKPANDLTAEEAIKWLEGNRKWLGDIQMIELGDKFHAIASTICSLQAKLTKAEAQAEGDAGFILDLQARVGRSLAIVDNLKLTIKALHEQRLKDKEEIEVLAYKSNESHVKVAEQAETIAKLRNDRLEQDITTVRLLAESAEHEATIARLRPWTTADGVKVGAGDIVWEGDHQYMAENFRGGVIVMYSTQAAAIAAKEIQ